MNEPENAASSLTSATMVAIATVLALAVVSGIATREWQRAHSASERSDRVVTAADNVLADLSDMETGQRGFLLVGEEKYLEPYAAGLSRLDQDIVSFRAAANGHTAPTLTTKVAALAAARQALIDSTITLRRAGRAADAIAIVRTDRGKAIMDSVRSAIAAAKMIEHDSVSNAARGELRWSAIFRVVLVAGTLLLVGILLALRRAVIRYASDQRDFVREMELQLKDLEDQSRRAAGPSPATP